jgi:hypothetical protein
MYRVNSDQVMAVNSLIIICTKTKNVHGQGISSWLCKYVALVMSQDHVAHAAPLTVERCSKSNQ